MFDLEIVKEIDVEGEKIAVFGRVLAISQSNVVKFFDISTATSPEHVSDIVLPSNVFDLEGGNKLYALTETGVVVFNEFFEKRFVASATGGGKKIKVDGSRLYILQLTSVVLIDESKITRVNFQEELNDFDVAEGIVYVLSDRKVYILRQDLKPLSEIDVGGKALVVVGSNVYISKESSLYMFNMQDLCRWEKLKGECRFSRIKELEYSTGDFLFILDTAGLALKEIEYDLRYEYYSVEEEIFCDISGRLNSVEDFAFFYPYVYAVGKKRMYIGEVVRVVIVEK